jgi:hypothetical protein
MLHMLAGYSVPMGAVVPQRLGGQFGGHTSEHGGGGSSCPSDIVQTHAIYRSLPFNGGAGTKLGALPVLLCRSAVMQA